MPNFPPISHEPVAYATLLNAFIDVIVAFGAPMNDIQKATVITLVWAASAIFVRAKVTPNVWIDATPAPTEPPAPPAPSTPPAA